MSERFRKTRERIKYDFGDLNCWPGNPYERFGFGTCPKIEIPDSDRLTFEALVLVAVLASEDLGTSYIREKALFHLGHINLPPNATQKQCLQFLLHPPEKWARDVLLLTRNRTLAINVLHGLSEEGYLYPDE